MSFLATHNASPCGASAVLCLAVIVAAPARGEAMKAAGCAPGAEMPAFFVREVTSPRPNRAICLVCRYGQRPVTLLCVRELDEQVAGLIAGVDAVVEDQRGRGLKGFAIFLDAEIRTDQPKLVTLARQRKLAMPLVFPVETSGPPTLELPEEAQVTVLQYRERTVQRRFVFMPGELTDERIREVVESTRDLADE